MNAIAGSDTPFCTSHCLQDSGNVVTMTDDGERLFPAQGYRRRTIGRRGVFTSSLPLIGPRGIAELATQTN